MKTIYLNIEGKLNEIAKVYSRFKRSFMEVHQSQESFPSKNFSVNSSGELVDNSDFFGRGSLNYFIGEGYSMYSSFILTMDKQKRRGLFSKLEINISSEDYLKAVGIAMAVKDLDSRFEASRKIDEE